MKAMALICARGGSKGLPGKNIKFFNGKPLIAWAIEHALTVKKIDRVIVSTDSEEIAEIAKKYGAEVPFIRPIDLALDDSPEWLVWRHALNYINDSAASLPDIMVSIPTTAPLRLPIDIERCINEYERGNSDVVITVTDSHRNPYFNMVKKNPDGTVDLVISSNKSINHRQNAPQVYDMTTICYVVNSKFVLTHNSIFEGRVKAVHIPIDRSTDIDTILDFELAESYLSIRNRKL